MSSREIRSLLQIFWSQGRAGSGRRRARCGNAECRKAARSVENASSSDSGTRTKLEQLRFGPCDRCAEDARPSRLARPSCVVRPLRLARPYRPACPFRPLRPSHPGRLIRQLFLQPLPLTTRLAYSLSHLLHSSGPTTTDNDSRSYVWDVWQACPSRTSQAASEQAQLSALIASFNGVA